MFVAMYIDLAQHRRLGVQTRRPIFEPVLTPTDLAELSLVLPCLNEADFRTLYPPNCSHIQEQHIRGEIIVAENG